MADYSILEAFEGGIERPKTSILYQGGLVFVAMAMVLLPLVYLALVLALAAVVYYHAVYDWSPIMSMGGLSGGGRIIIFKFLIYFTPLVVGIVVVFFMIKPIFARRPKRAQPLALNPATEPLLYAFIDKICATVGAPAPKRIDLDCELNAAASFRRGFLSFLGNDMVLVLGLPLVANLSTREFAGVVAHEFGHFSQGLGMRLSYIIRRVNMWFARVAYERDAWDVALERWSMTEEDGRVAMIIWTSQLGIWFSRMILRLLMLIGHIICGFMLRQMEYDADAYEIKLAGSEAFETTARKFATLGAAMAQADKEMVQKWKKYRTLPDNLPELIRSQHESLAAQTHQQINDTLGLKRTGWFDSHPSPADRIARARRVGTPGIFRDESPASSLFTSFDHPARFVTLLHYTDDLGIPITQQMLSPVQSTRTPAPAATPISISFDNEYEAYFGGAMKLLLPLRLRPISPAAADDAEFERLKQLGSALSQVAPELVSIREQYVRATELLLQARAAHWLLVNGIAVDPGQFGRSESTVEAATSAEKEAAATRDRLRASLHEVASAITQRLELGISLALATCADPAQVMENAASLTQDADTYALRRELVEAFAVFVNIAETKTQRGGSPALARAEARQTQIITGLAAQLEPKPVAASSEAKTGLKLRTETGSGDLPDLKGIMERNRAWLENYQHRLEELVQLAKAGEGVPA